MPSEFYSYPRRDGKETLIIKGMEADIALGRHVHYHSVDGVWCSLSYLSRDRCPDTLSLQRYIDEWKDLNGQEEEPSPRG